ncbi:Embryonic polarity [Nesidiocoris tenuis]|uniref:Embryonic polarity n=1 Tax=Nesidiocoris tenuis TaxID=355587 RepID=A0ABN7A5T1_9HEMI|nr:Embryonic polarity [Nesidiocoris tenuis]
MHETEQMKLRAAGEVLTVKREPETSPNPYIWQQYGGGASELPPMVNKMSPIYGSRTPSPLGYQANAMHPVSSQVPASIMSPVHPVTAAAVSVAGMSPISQPTQADVTYSGGTVYQAHLGAQYLPSEPRTVGRDNLLDMDAQNCNVDLQLNSKELADLGVLEGSLSANLSISDTVGVRRPDNNQNMTDSLTRLVTSRYNELCDLDMYSGPN